MSRDQRMRQPDAGQPPVAPLLALDFTGVKRATISPCGKYRYALFRSIVGKPGGHLAWIMLNPSTADAVEDDPTIRKVVGFTDRAGYAGALVVNLFAWRATDPREMRRVLRENRSCLAVAEGPDNRAAIEAAVTGSSAVVCAWGAQPWARDQAKRVVSWLHAMSDRGLYVPRMCLGWTKHGDPLHPLMPSYDGHPLVAFDGAAS